MDIIKVRQAASTLATRQPTGTLFERPVRSSTEQILKDIDLSPTDTPDRVKEKVRKALDDETKKPLIDNRTIRDFGRFLQAIQPAGALQTTTPFDTVGSQFGSKRGGTNTVDTIEHFRISTETRRLRQQALKTRLDGDNEAMEKNRQQLNDELINKNLMLQTLPFATKA